MTRIEGAVAVVTGGASGIGRGIAEQLIAEGAEVVVADVQLDVCEATAAEIGATAMHVDVTSAASVESLAAATLDRFGHVDIVVNNAGIGPLARVADLTLADWRWMIDVNLWGVVHGVTTFLPLLRANEHGGHIVNTASNAMFSINPGLGAYSATKFAVGALTETMAVELAEEGSDVHVTILTPGPVRTNIKASSRNRPAGLEGGLEDVDISNDPAYSGLRWIDPIEAGRITTRAIRADELYAITHPELWDAVGARHDAIRAAFDRYPPSPAPTTKESP